MKQGILLPYLKAVVAGVVAFAGGMAVGYTDGALTAAELWTTIASTGTAVGTVWGVPWLPKVSDVQGRHERGAITVGISGFVAALVIVALVLWILSMLGVHIRIG